MTGPVAASRPLWRSGSTFILKQLSGPAETIIPRPFASRSLSSSTRPIPTRQLPICLACRFQSRLRFYSTNLPPTNPNDQSNPSQDSKDVSESESSGAVPPPTEESHSTPPPPPPPRQEQEQEPTISQHELPSQADSRRSTASQNFSHFMDNLQSRVLVASQTLNDLTGYSAIESIKATNARLEADLATAQEDLRRARQQYKAVNAQRAGTQREVTTLLARKDTWTPLDLERFTTLYRQDHELEAAVAEASTRLTEAEADEARLSQALNSGILKRYHEEQIWSDRIRRQSTWGTWGLMGVNFLLFLILQFVAEPWKRNRLMKGIAAEEKAALEAVRRELEEVKEALTAREAQEAAKATADATVAAASAAAAAAAADAAAATAASEAIVEDAGVEAIPIMDIPNTPIHAIPAPPRVSWKEFISDPSQWRPALEDLYSERRIDLRMRDASFIALEGAVTGAAVVASVALVLMRWS